MTSPVYGPLNLMRPHQFMAEAPQTAEEAEARFRQVALIRKFLRFWPIAEAVASMSKDPSTKVGALALDSNFNIISTGFNGFPRGVGDDPTRYSDRETKLKLVCHAEQNVVAQAAYGGRSLKGSTVLLTALYPCASCAKSMIQAGVIRVLTVDPDSNPRWADEAKWSKILFDEASVEVIHVKKGCGPDGSEVWEVNGTVT